MFKRKNVWIKDPSGRSHLAYGNEVWRSSGSGQFDQFLQISSHLVHRGTRNISYCWIHKGMVNHLPNPNLKLLIIITRPCSVNDSLLFMI